MLYQSQRHEALAGARWNPGSVHAKLVEIVADLEDAQGQDHLWPTHPLDDEGHGRINKSLYAGAAGVSWALAHLQHEGVVSLRRPLNRSISAIHLAYLAGPDTGEVAPSYHLGEVGILLIGWRIAPSTDIAKRLAACIDANIGNRSNESLWGATGTMLAAWHMLNWTGNDLWRELWLRNVEQVWRTWQPDDSLSCHMWTQQMYGRVRQFFGAGHGFAGNVYPLLRGAALLPPAQREVLFDRCEATLRHLAEVEGDQANWPPTATTRATPDKLLVQWCHGAPGIVTAMAAFPGQRSPDVEELLIQGSNLIWAAGPLSKGYGLCHGTCGNGCAFLAQYERSGDPDWLDKARAFAMHALQQRDSMRQRYGQGRYSLWTGDAGLAVYLWQCLRGTAGMPGLDYL